MLWDIIRDFIVQNITGGTNSQDQLFSTTWGGWLGDVAGVGNTEFTYQVGSNPILDDGIVTGYQPMYITGADWLATTLTIIAMCLLFAFAVWLIRWVFKAVSSAFLLRR